MTDEHSVEPIAIVGLAVRAPGAADAQEFWRNLIDGRESVRELSREEQLAAGATEADLSNPSWVSAAPVLDQLEHFDAELFGMTAREAQLADPQHRLFLESAHTALEDAGYDPARYPGSIGVYAGSGHVRYEWLNLRTNRSLWAGDAGQLSVTTVNSPDYVATQVSYRMNLRGPSLTIHTACSTSLVALHLACEALRNGECELALAGGVSVELPHRVGYLGMEGYVSPDGHCRPFDADAAGTVWGSGAGVVVVKRLADAIADGDRIRAVVRGNAVNNDGTSKVGFSAPSVSGQAAVIAQAVEVADIDPRSITYVEAHGTGTALGDPIEVAALTSVYGPRSSDRQWCAIGSVKSNIGHLSQAAGIVGVVKAVLSLEHGMIPPSLHYERPNPEIDFEQSPFYVASVPAKFEPAGGPRRAAVSSFGVGGTNAHVVLEEAPVPEPGRVAPARSAEVLQLSARTPSALQTAARQLADHLAQRPELPLADVAHTLRVGRTARAHRAAVVATDAGDAVTGLRSGKRLVTGVAGEPPRVAFLFSGQGSQYAGMGAELYGAEPAFAAAVDECLAVLGPDFRELLFDPAAAERLQETRHTQPALFVLEYALAMLWRSWGVEPAAMLGHSVGEYVAATLAGVFRLADALRLVSRRGELMQSVPAGAMLAVPLAESDVSGRLPAELVVATVNGPGTCVVAGPTEAVAQFAEALQADGVGARRLRTSHAFHSPMMAPILADFEAAVAAVPRSAPQARFWSNVTGAPITDEQATDPGYWAAHLRQPVRFGDAVASILAQAGGGPWHFVECGPGRQLAGLVRLQLAKGQPAPLPSLPSQPGSELATLYAAAGRLWTAGSPVTLDASAAGRRRVALPTYPFERQRHWSDPDPVTGDGAGGAGAQSAGRRGADEEVSAAAGPLPVPDRFAVPTWRQLPGAPADQQLGACAVVVAGARGRALAAALRFGGAAVTEFPPGQEPAAVAAASHVIHATALDGAPVTDVSGGWAAQQEGFFSALALVQAVAARPEAAGPIRLDLITSETEDPVPGGLRRPEHATLAGVARVAPLEVAELAVRRIDTGPETAADEIVGELRRAAPDPGEPAAEVALRAGRRWALRYEQVSLPGGEPRLREGGGYLITGGLGGIGITIAEDLARRTRGELLLVARTGLPPRDQWQEYLAEHGLGDRTGRAIAAIRRMERAGATVHVRAVDITDPEQLRELRRSGPLQSLHGIVHAAGLPGGGLAEVRQRADAEAVLGPKLAGTLALRAAYGDLALDFVVLCSSVTAVTGGLGQLDYCAANAFLDAYARSEHGWSTRVVSVNWGGWSEVGMAAEVAAPEGLRASDAAVTPLSHPVLTARTSRSVSGRISADSHWLVDQHRIAEVPVVPGTGHVECAREALTQLLPAPQPGQVISLQDVVFTEPLSVPADLAARYQVDVSPDGEFRISSGLAGRQRTHAQGRGQWVTPPPAAGVDLAAVTARCTRAGAPAAGERGSIVSFGPRWDCLREVYRGDREELARLELPAAATGDLARWGLHPALLDVATSFGFRAAEGTYLPMGYGRVLVRAPLPAVCFSHLRYHPDGGEVMSAEVTLVDSDGQVLVEITDFMLRRIDPAAVSAGLTAPASVALDAAASGDAISPEEGAEALRRLLAADLGPQVVVAASPLAVLREKTRRLDTETAAAAAGATGDDPAAGSVSTDEAGYDDGYVAPRTELEAQLAEVWSSVLGVSRVGAEDDFFTLGGNSLVAVQLIAQVRSAVRVKLPMRSLFAHPTVAGMAEQVESLRKPEAAGGESQITRIQRG
ncbi:acyltransferase domain-containing protein [Natronosporangium hydrolyticum]|uniref:Acyltransferase domain-containing protein n=1 Tax=Natronosporangium hydrolyticum TaxID=2811111 RepID=A0A895YQN1_9ACTN|nr:type I polyketide synthase [Natronosporangium hydrolyticum]QSB16308.1 acyltransferase domain-containing protein [Natronosporangium hydrolyticum]